MRMKKAVPGYVFGMNPQCMTRMIFPMLILETHPTVSRRGSLAKVKTMFVAGSLACLEYAHTHGAAILPDTCSSLVTLINGSANCMRLECFKYAHQHGSHLSKLLPEHAARDGHLELLTYLHQQGCELSDNAAFLASQYHRRNCLNYISKHRGASSGTS